MLDNTPTYERLFAPENPPGKNEPVPFRIEQTRNPGVFELIQTDRGYSAILHVTKPTSSETGHDIKMIVVNNEEPVSSPATIFWITPTGDYYYQTTQQIADTRTFEINANMGNPFTPLRLALVYGNTGAFQPLTPESASKQLKDFEASGMLRTVIHQIVGEYDLLPQDQRLRQLIQVGSPDFLQELKSKFPSKMPHQFQLPVRK